MILQAPTRKPARLRPCTSEATVVVLPAFIEVPATNTVGGHRGGGAGAGNAPSARFSRHPSASASRPTGSSRVAAFTDECRLRPREATPPAATSSHGPRSSGSSASNWSGA